MTDEMIVSFKIDDPKAKIIEMNEKNLAKLERNYNKLYAEELERVFAAYPGAKKYLEETSNIKVINKVVVQKVTLD